MKTSLIKKLILVSVGWPLVYWNTTLVEIVDGSGLFLISLFLISNIILLAIFAIVLAKWIVKAELYDEIN